MNDTTLAEWLRLREHADAKARSRRVLNAVVSSLPEQGPLRVLELATGAGSNLRYLIERLPPRQEWLVVDRSPLLLAALIDRTRAWAEAKGMRAQVDDTGLRLLADDIDCRIDVMASDLSQLDAPLFHDRHLVTASALLDLVSEQWLTTLAARCHAVSATALFTITYDGRSSCLPAEPEDENVRALMNQHQGRDKGLGGPAAGPNAAAAAEHAFARAGYHVATDTSDWSLDEDEGAMQEMLVNGWADAARETQPHQAAVIAAWQRRRLTHIRDGRSRIVVGHRDVAAWPDAR